MASIHMKNLANLCRVCGERLQKSKTAVTSKFLCMKWKDFLAEKFEIFVEKDLEKIHPQYFVIHVTCILTEEHWLKPHGLLITMITVEYVPM